MGPSAAGRGQGVGQGLGRVGDGGGLGVGQVAGPAVVGMLNDHLAATHGQLAIRYSLLIVAVTPVLAGIAMWRAAAHYAADIERAAR